MNLFRFSWSASSRGSATSTRRWTPSSTPSSTRTSGKLSSGFSSGNRRRTRTGAAGTERTGTGCVRGQGLEPVPGKNAFWWRRPSRYSGTPWQKSSRKWVAGKKFPKKPKTTFLLKRSKGLNWLGCKIRIRAEAFFAVSWCVFKERSQFFYCVKTRQLTAFEASEWMSLWCLKNVQYRCHRMWCLFR